MAMTPFTPSETDIVHRTRVDLILRPVQNTIHIVQYDDQLPVIEVELYKNGSVYTLPQNAEVWLRWGIKDHVYTRKLAYVSTDRTKVYFRVTYNMDYFYGNVNPILVVDDGTGKTAGSSPLAILIDKNPIQYAEGPAAPEDEILEEIRNLAEEAGESTGEAEQARDEAVEAATTATTKAGEATTAATTATNAKNDAVAAKDTAVSSASTATDKASEATTAASTATSAKNDAVAAKDTAVSSASTATEKAGEASASATTATNAKNDAVAAKEAAEAAAETVEDMVLMQAIAQKYSSSKVYKAGELLTYGSKLYECIAPAPAGTLPTDTTYFIETTVDDKKITFGSSWFDGTGGVKYAEEAGLAEGIATDRTIDNPEDSCPPITFGTVGGEAEIQTGINKFLTLFGNSIKYNQLFQVTPSLSQYKTNDTTLRFNNTSLADYAVLNNQPRCTIGHKYFFDIRYTGSETQPFYYYINDNFMLALNASRIFTCNSNTQAFAIYKYINNPTLTGTLSFKLIDLTSMGLGSVTTVDEAIAALKALGVDPNQYLPYNESAILSSKSASLISRGFNAWDEEWEVGQFNTLGQKVSASSDIRSKNPIPVIANTAYFAKCPENVYLTICFYDANLNQCAENVYKQNATFQTPENCKYISICTNGSYGTTYNHDICINLNQWGDTIDTSRNGEYVPYRSQTVTLPNIELRGIPYQVVEDGKTVIKWLQDEVYSIGGGKRRVGIYTFTGNENFSMSDTYTSEFTLYSLPFSNCKGYDATQTAKVQICGYEAASANTLGSKTSGVALWSTCLRFKEPLYAGNLSGFKAYIAGKTILYELATETDIPESENPGWTENVYTDNWGTLEFTTDPVQNPQVPQPYFIEYTISLTEWVDSAYTRTNGDANTIATEDELDAIRGGNDVVGKAKLADNLESNNKTALLSAYVFGQSPTGKADSILMDKIVGGDVAFNQHARELTSDYWSAFGGTATYSSGVATLTASAQYGNLRNKTGYYFNIISGHKYLMLADIKLTTGSTNVKFALRYNNSTATFTYSTVSTTSWQTVSGIVSANGSYNDGYLVVDDWRTSDWDAIQIKNVMFIDLTQMFGSSIANYLYNLETATAGAGVNKFRLLFPKAYYPYNAGELLPVRTVGRKAVGINQWDEEWELSTDTYDTNKVVASKNLIRVLPNTQYCFVNSTVNISSYGLYLSYYDGNGTLIYQSRVYDGESWNNKAKIFTTPANCAFMKFGLATSYYGTTYNHDICLNISDPSINGAFYPYVENTYPVDDVALHGVFKLDANNNIVTDGDEYTPDGKVLRRYKTVDLSTLDWALSTANIWFVNLDIKNLGEGISEKYERGIEQPSSVSAGKFSTYWLYATSTPRLYLNNGSTTTKPSGFLTYEVLDASQTEETHSAYASTQVKGTTQQWLEPEWAEEETPIMVPVGNQVTLFDDLKKKVEIAADMPADDGTYVLNKSGGSNTYTPLETWLGNNGYNKMQVLSATFGAKAALGGTLRQLLAVKESLDFDNTTYVDLGDIDWNYNGTTKRFSSVLSNAKIDSSWNGCKNICSKYKTGAVSSDASTNNRIGINDGTVYVSDNSYTDPTAFKAAMKGVLLAYEKASS